MSLNDPISNLLTIIRNGVQVNKETVDIPASKLMGRIFNTDGKQDVSEAFKTISFDVNNKIQNTGIRALEVMIRKAKSIVPELNISIKLKLVHQSISKPIFGKINVRPKKQE